MTSTYLYLEGIEGGCQADRHVGWIDIMSYTMGHSRLGGDGSAAETGLVLFHSVELTKTFDQSTPALALACSQGGVIEQATLEIYDHETARAVVSFTMNDCTISAIQLSGSDGADWLPMENVTLDFRRIEWKYTHTRDDGSADAPISVVLEVPGGANTHRSPIHVHRYEPKTAFLMMWMDPERPELDDVNGTLKEVCREYGITAVRADDVQHDERVTDVILERIANSEYLIADLTGQRPNVYYEVGHAHPLGRRPILYRKKGTEISFDLAVHNVKEYRNLTELRTLLQTRLDALVR